MDCNNSGDMGQMENSVLIFASITKGDLFLGETCFSSHSLIGAFMYCVQVQTMPEPFDQQQIIVSFYPFLVKYLVTVNLSLKHLCEM